MDSLGVFDIKSYIIKAYGNAERALGNIGIGKGDESVNSFRESLQEPGSQLQFSQLRKSIGNKIADVITITATGGKKKPAIKRNIFIRINMIKKAYQMS